MKNKVFLICFFSAVVLHSLFFHLFRIESPGVIAITESEVYLIENISVEGDTAKINAADDSSKIAPFFSLPGVYQKIYSSNMKHSVSTLREEADISAYDPFKQDKKIISRSMDFSTTVNGVTSKTNDFVTNGEKKLLDSLTKNRTNGFSIKLSDDLLKFFNEDIINDELKGQLFEPGAIMNVQVVFFNKNSFSVLFDSKDKIPSKKMFLAFNKALLPRRLVPKRLNGNIYVGSKK